MPLSTEETDSWLFAFDVPQESTKVVLQYPGCAGGANIDLLELSMWRLRPMKWMDDDLINAYTYLLQQRADRDLHPDRRGSLYVSSMFVSKLESSIEYNYTTANTWFRGVDLRKLDYIYIPVTVSNSHWYAIIVDVASRCVRCFDSLGLQDRTSTLKRICAYLEDAAPMSTAWAVESTVIYRGGNSGALVTPQQSNKFDCGLFTIMAFNYHSRGLPMLFSEAYMGTFRGRAALDIMRQRVD
jgi:sentrin-specific protease 1